MDDKIKESYNLHHNRMSDLSFIILRFYWDLSEYIVFIGEDNKIKRGRPNGETYKYIRKLYNAYMNIYKEYVSVVRLVENINTHWGKYYRLSYDNDFNYDFIDSSSPGDQLSEINKKMLVLIPVHKMQRKYKLWYKKKLKSIRKIQRNWKISRYNPAYKLCWLTQINNIKLFGKIKFKDIDTYIN